MRGRSLATRSEFQKALCVTYTHTHFHNKFAELYTLSHTNTHTHIYMHILTLQVH